jgi:NADP-dependent 3-hydroxy acid dehydrogenase YdfG
MTACFLLWRRSNEPKGCIVTERRVMLVTGASSGIGAATARAAAAAGLGVALLARRADNLRELVDEIGSDRAMAVSCDAADFAGQAEAVEKVIQHFGRLDIAFANAGTGYQNQAPKWVTLRNGERWLVSM